MNRHMPDWAVVGASMIARSTGWRTRYGIRTKIAKVLGNGNIKVDGRDEQLRPWGDGIASQRGYRGDTFVLVTPEVEADIIRQADLDEARIILAGEIDRLQSIRHDDGMLAEAVAIKVRAKAAP